MFRGSSDEITRRDSGRDAARGEGRGEWPRYRAATRAEMAEMTGRAGPGAGSPMDTEEFRRAKEAHDRLIDAGAPARDVSRASLKIMHLLGSVVEVHAPEFDTEEGDDEAARAAVEAAFSRLLHGPHPGRGRPDAEEFNLARAEFHRLLANAWPDRRPPAREGFRVLLRVLRALGYHVEMPG